MGDEDLVASGRKKVRIFKCKFVEIHANELQNVVIVKPIVYGNVARYFGKKREEDGHTHSWSCYLRPFKNEVNIVFYIMRTYNDTQKGYVILH